MTATQAKAAVLLIERTDSASGTRKDMTLEAMNCGSSVPFSSCLEAVHNETRARLRILPGSA